MNNDQDRKIIIVSLVDRRRALVSDFSGAAVDGKDLDLGMAAVTRVFKFCTCCPCRRAVKIDGNGFSLRARARSKELVKSRCSMLECAVLPTWVDLIQSVSNVKRYKAKGISHDKTSLAEGVVVGYSTLAHVLSGSYARRAFANSVVFGPRSF